MRLPGATRSQRQTLQGLTGRTRGARVGAPDSLQGGQRGGFLQRVRQRARAHDADVVVLKAARAGRFERWAKTQRPPSEVQVVRPVAPGGTAVPEWQVCCQAPQLQSGKCVTHLQCCQEMSPRPLSITFAGRGNRQ